MTPDVLPYGRQWIDEADLAAVAGVLKSSYLTQGPEVEAFEEALCRYTGAKYAVAVANGTAALHLAVAALGLEAPASGVTSPITFLASANAMVYNGVVPFFADIDPVTANISPEAMEKKMRVDTKVVIPVHFAGRPADMPAIADIAKRRGCAVIEDAAHALGSVYPSGGRVGNCQFSDMTIFSFHPVKTITTGEGGAVMTNDEKLYERLKILRSHGMVRDPKKMSDCPGPWFYEMQELGFNFRLTDIQAALGQSQLSKLDMFASRRKEIVAGYNRAFSDLSWLKPLSTDEQHSVYHLYVVRMDFARIGMPRRDVMEFLKARGVGTQVHYVPVHTQPYYRQKFGMRAGDCPHAEEYYEHCLSLPLYPAMKDEDVGRVIESVRALA